MSGERGGERGKEVSRSSWLIRGMLGVGGLLVSVVKAGDDKFTSKTA